MRAKGEGADGVLNTAVPKFLPDAVVVVQSTELCRIGKVVTLYCSGQTREVLEAAHLCGYVRIVTTVLGDLYLVLVAGGVTKSEYDGGFICTGAAQVQVG